MYSILLHFIVIFTYTSSSFPLFLFPTLITHRIWCEGICKLWYVWTRRSGATDVIPIIVRRPSASHAQPLHDQLSLQQSLCTDGWINKCWSSTFQLFCSRSFHWFKEYQIIHAVIVCLSKSITLTNISNNSSNSNHNNKIYITYSWL